MAVRGSGPCLVYKTPDKCNYAHKTGQEKGTEGSALKGPSILEGNRIVRNKLQVCTLMSKEMVWSIKTVHFV